MVTKIDARQLISRDLLEQLFPSFPVSQADGKQLDAILQRINEELTPPLRLMPSSPADLIVTVESIFVTNSDTNRKKTISPISNLLPNFTSGTATFPSTPGGTVTVSPGTNVTFPSISANEYVLAGFSLDKDGNIVIKFGTAGTTLFTSPGTDAGIPKAASGTQAIGMVALQNVGGTIQNVDHTNIYQFAGSGGGGASAFSEFTITNNQSSASDVTDFLIDTTENNAFSAEISVRRLHYDAGGAENSTFYTNLGTGGVDGDVNSLYVQDDDTIIIGGSFSNVGTTGSVRLAKLAADGTPDAAFAANMSNGFGFDVEEVVVQDDGKILVGGSFTTFNLNTRNRLVRLNSDGTEDSAFYTNLGSGASNNVIYTIAVQDDGKILVGGDFTQIGAGSNTRLARLNADGTEDATFNANIQSGGGFNGRVRSIVVQDDGKILVGGFFTTYGGNPRNKMVRLNSDGTEDSAFYTNLGLGFSVSGGDEVLTIAVQPSDNKILVGGQFSTLDGNSKANLVRLNPDGSEDSDFYTNSGVMGLGGTNNVFKVVIQENHKIIVGADFDSTGAGVRRKITRLNRDGTDDATFYTNTSGALGIGVYRVYDLGLQSTGDIIVGGNFVSFGGNTRNNLVKLDADIFSNLSKQGTLRGYYDSFSEFWNIGETEFIGDDVGITFSMTDAGQLQYTSTNLSGTLQESIMRFIINGL